MRCCTLLCLVAIAGCNKDDAKAGTSAAGSAGHAAVAAPATVDIFVDDQPVGKLAVREVGLWPRLDTLVPVSARRYGMWQTITLKGKTGATTDMQQPSATYPELVPAIFPGDNGPAFGMFDPVELAKHGKPSLREDGIAQIRIKLALNSGRGQNEHGEGGGSDPTKLELAIKTPKGNQAITGDALLALPRQPVPGDTSSEAKGWPLSQLLAHAGVKMYTRVRLNGESGSSVTLEKKDLDEKSSIPFIKLNRQGTLRFRVFKKQGTTWQPTGGDLRGLVGIEVLK